MNFLDYAFVNNDSENIFSKMQWADFLSLKNNLIMYLSHAERCYSPCPADYWRRISKTIPSVLTNCDAIDYQDSITADAYAICHLLDRYHRFQLMQEFLLKNNLTIRKIRRPIDILDVGTGPAPALFAFSDFYNILNQISGENLYLIRQNYVEQSNGFRQFLHHFCELSDRKYDVPFHHGTFLDFLNIQFDEKYYNPGQSYRTQKHRYDIVLFSNFLTSKAGVLRFKKELREVCRAVRNYGLIIVVGAAGTRSKKYQTTYSTCDAIISRPFKNHRFTGTWKKIVHHEFLYNYTDKYGNEMREFYKFIEQKIDNTNTSEEIPCKTREFLQRRIQNTPQKTAEDGWLGVSWDLVIYRKHARASQNAKE